jgi:SAM-dependent methyltransferase
MKRHAPAADRNRGPILEVLLRVLPARGLVLELASGSGQHALHFAAALPDLTWQPSDPDPTARASIDAYAAEAALPNLRPAIAVDASDPAWTLAARGAVAIVCINMIHISPWAATEGLFAGAGAALPAGGVLVLYGPYRMDGATAPSNEEFDRSLRARDPAWGVRDTRDLDVEAAITGLARRDTIAMPANNHCLIYRRDG